MFEHDYELMPRTYSIKSYTRRRTSGLKKFFKYSFYVLVIVSVLSISALSAVHFI